MRKNYLGWFVLLTFLLLGCRNEDFVNQSANTKREEEFFREALSKTARIKNGNTIVAALKKQNDRSHFVSKMKDQSGLPVWDRVITIKNSKVANKGEGGDDFEELIIPLTENDKDLSSILSIKKNTDNSYSYENINNNDVKGIVYNTQIDKTFREQILSTFITVDHLTFSSDAVYWNIPDDLYSFIPESQTYPQRRFKINVANQETDGSANNLLSTNVYCLNFQIDDPNCSCHGTVNDTYCWVIQTGGGGGGTGNGDGNPGDGTPGDGGSGGGGGTGTPGGNPTGGSDCGGENRAFYKIIPCDGEGDFPFTYYYSLTKEERDWLSLHNDIAQGFENYLNSVSPYNSGISFVTWGVNFLMQNENTTWEQFINSKHDGEPNSSIDIQNNISGNYDETSYGNFDFENPQTQWLTVNSVIPVSDFVGWNAPGINKNCMDYAKAQIAKKGYKISNYYDVDSKGEKQTFQIYTEQNGVNLNDLYKGVSYIKYALSKGIPVIVGVDDDPGSPGNLDNSTDHFVVIVGMGVDSKGQFFRFFDNASGNDPQNQGANPENKFYYNYSQKIFTGKTFCSGYRNTVAHDYIITMIRKSK